MLTKHSKQPLLGIITMASHSLRIIRPLFNLQDGTMFCKWLNVARFKKLTQHSYFTEEVLCDLIRFSSIVRLSTHCTKSEIFH